ncbi:MAG: hypothetical protein Q7L55_10260 [Actinomycetota bacterium]|nr:hypothetical protein [Actinomycetota bacterium]
MTAGNVRPEGTRPILLLDLDEVLFPFADAYDRWLACRRGYGLDPVLKRAYDVGAAAGSGHRELAVQFVNDPAVIATVPPRSNARSALRVLEQTYTLMACTSRREALEGEATRAWLRRYFPEVNEALFTSQDHSSPVRTKAALAEEVGAAALVDDTMQHLADLPPTCVGLLLKRPPGMQSEPGSRHWATTVRVLLEPGHRPEPASGEARVLAEEGRNR